MPVIPSYQPRSAPTGSAAIQVPEGPDVGRTTAVVGQALGQVAQSRDYADRVENEIRERDAATWAGKALATSRAEWDRQMLERSQAAPLGAPDFTPTLLKDYDEYTQNVLRSAPTRTARQYLEERFAEVRGSLGNDALRFETGSRIQLRTNQIGEAVDASRKVVRNKPEQFDALLAEQVEAIDASGLPADARAKLILTAKDALAADAVIGSATADPIGTLARLHAEPGKSGNSAIEAMSADTRDQLIRFSEAEMARLVTLQNQRDAQNERYERDINDEYSKRGDELLAAGKLTTEWIRDNRDNLSPQDVRYFLNKATGGGDGTRDLVTYADLSDRAAAGEDVRRDARDALLRGDILKADFDRVTSMSSGERPGWYKRGAQFIGGSAAVSDLNPDPAAAQRKAQMLDDWDQWAVANPKATDDEARTAYNRIVDEYSIIDRSKMVLTMRKPMFLVGGYQAPDLAATKAQTVKAFREERIDRAEFDRQAALIQQWEAAAPKAKSK